MHPWTVGLRQIDFAQRPRRAGQGLRGASFREWRPRRLPVSGAAPVAMANRGRESRFCARQLPGADLALERAEIPLSCHDRPIRISRLLSPPDFGRHGPAPRPRAGFVRGARHPPDGRALSGLDEITARRIRADLLSIWEETRKTIVFVTHNAYEACFLADRILVMSGGAFQQEMRVPIARPRSYDDPAIFQFSRDVIKAFGDEIGREPVPSAVPASEPGLVDDLDRHAAARMNI